MNRLSKINEQSIFKILSRRTGSGVFTKIVDLADGKRISHKCGWVVGMHSSFISKQYERHFGIDLPAWVEVHHPQHVILLCQLAIRNNCPLPAIYAQNKE